jgi:hypothetical protein
MPMPKQIGDNLERAANPQEPLGEGVAKGMRREEGGVDAGAAQPSFDSSGDRQWPDRQVRPVDSQEDVVLHYLGPETIHVSAQRRGDRGRESVSDGLSSFVRAEDDPASAPVDVGQAQINDLATTDPVGGQKEQDRQVTCPARVRRLNRSEDPRDLLIGECPGHVVEAVSVQPRNCPHVLVRRPPLSRAEPQEQPKGRLHGPLAREAPPRPRANEVELDVSGRQPAERANDTAVSREPRQELPRSSKPLHDRTSAQAPVVPQPIAIGRQDALVPARRSRHLVSHEPPVSTRPPGNTRTLLRLHSGSDLPTGPVDQRYAE